MKLTDANVLLPNLTFRPLVRGGKGRKWMPLWYPWNKGWIKMQYIFLSQQCFLCKFFGVNQMTVRSSHWKGNWRHSCALYCLEYSVKIRWVKTWIPHSDKRKPFAKPRTDIRICFVTVFVPRVYFKIYIWPFSPKCLTIVTIKYLKKWSTTVVNAI